ncbi:inner ear-specific collagen [Esox lucius]|uniref:inner ear-specific collagen n=1 Tax=Esox lucius TaxID=8010 RepID=UPI001476CF65|nr:inner ear-specific collagen [Esox lucius]
MMAQDSKGMMTTRLLGLLLCSTLSVAMYTLTPERDDNVPPFLDFGRGYTAQADDNTAPADDNLYPPMPPFLPEENVHSRSGLPPMLPPGFTDSGMNGTDNLPPGDSVLEPDMSYCLLLQEAPIPPPMDQVPWFCVCSLCKASVGPKGDHGDRGLPGSPGSPGMRGLTGFRGRPGFVGHQGLKGQKGDDGEKGDQGPMGFRGPKGDIGFKGDKGDQGLEGPQGEMGPQGEAGTCPASCLTVQGRSGEPGVPGPAGPRGLPGIVGPPGAIGPKGVTGDIGPPGVQGKDGAKGDQGLEGQCHCTDGKDGIDGHQGPQGPKGDHGQAGPQGVKGLAGEKGDQGEIGIVGLPGPCSPAIQSSFSASLTQVFPSPNMPVPFSRVINNQQSHFNPAQGVYTAPINGTYVFSYHLVVSTKVLRVGLFHNYNPVVKTTEPNELGIASQQVVLHLDSGDRVWLQVKDVTSNGLYGDAEKSSTFSGFLLYPDSCDVPFSRDFNPPGYGNDDNQSYSWGTIEGPFGEMVESTPTPSP